MKLSYTIKLRCLYGGKKFSILTDHQHHVVDRDCDLELEIKHDYRSQPNLKFFSVMGMVAGAGQRVTVEDIKRNRGDWNFFPFCEFHMKDNLYVDNKIVSQCWELCFNGDFFINIEFDRKQFEFSRFYRSKRREDFIFDNNHLDNDKEHDYWCSIVCVGGEKNYHIRRWNNEPYLPEYRKEKKYDFGCFGCSITRGSGLRRGSEWPALVNLELGSVINLAEAALGVDGIFLNLRCALKEFRFGRVIILWPQFSRFLLRWRVDGWHLRKPLTIQSNSISIQDYGIWLTGASLERKIARFQSSDYQKWMVQRSQRIIARTIKLLSDRGVRAWHSSWDPDTYSFLRSSLSGIDLLPAFPDSDRGAMDGYHPSARQQGSWYESIKNKLLDS